MINIHIYNLKNYLSAKRVSEKYKNILTEKFFNNHYVLEIENEGDVVFNYKSYERL
jgi:ribosomal protein S17E